MQFRVIGPFRNVAVIAQGSGIRDLALLRARYGEGRWRTLKGNATVVVSTGDLRDAELHWYEAHGIGKRRMKIKRCS